MSVDIEPMELSFRRPFTVEVSQILTIKNPNSTPLAFKVKTTAPKQYCVRPNAGRIEPGSHFDVSVLLQAMKADPPADARCKDKFLVQSALITSDKEFGSISTVLENTDKSQMQERKIRVNWLAATSEEERNGATRNDVLSTPNKQSLVNGVSETPDTSRKYSSPRTSTPPSNPPPYPSDDAKEDDEPSEAPQSAVSQATTTVSTTAQATYEELKVRLAEAQAQIAGLKETSGLRQRNTNSTSSAEEKRPVAQAAKAVKTAVEGVPVQVAALLCLLSFLLAYFFF